MDGACHAELGRGTLGAYDPGAMTVEYLIGAIVSLLLIGYLVYALLKPEHF